jgi:Ni/Co efflux regulator RcnB
MRIASALAMSFLCTVAFGANASPGTPPRAEFLQLQVQYGGDQDRRNDNVDRDRYEDRNRDRNDARRDAERDGGRDRDRDARNEPHWAAGDRVSNEYLSPRYVVGQWERTGLSRPPRGHEWIRVGDEYMLVRVEDQKIAKVVFGDPRRPER